MTVTSTGVAGNCAVFLEAAGARQDALDLCMQYGTPITINLNEEPDVERDDLGSIMKRPIDTGFNTWAMPVEREPDERKLEKAGLRVMGDVIIHTPIQSWINAGYLADDTLGIDFSSIDMTRSLIILDGTEWKIADKALDLRVGPYPLYINFALKKN